MIVHRKEGEFPMKELTPQLLHSLKQYSRNDFTKDLTAGIIVAIIALPLSIALALASGVSPEQGLYTRSEERRVGKGCRFRWSPNH